MVYKVCVKIANWYCGRTGANMCWFDHLAGWLYKDSYK